MPIPFVKYSGCGNDFILVDNRSARLNPFPDAVAGLCHRRTGIGADGLLLIESSLKAACKMRIFNADGSEAEMCGNGIRCVAHYLSCLPPHPAQVSVETMHQLIELSINNGKIVTQFPVPTEIVFSKPLKINDLQLTIHYLHASVPHAVLFSGQIDEAAFPTLAPKIRFHKDFSPRGTNVNLARLLPDGTVKIRTYERGVEAETLACGTGAVATALAASAHYGLSSPITLRPLSGETLSIAFEGTARSPVNVTLTGPAVKVYEGVFSREQFGFPFA